MPLAAGVDPARAKAVSTIWAASSPPVGSAPNTYSGLAQGMIRVAKHFARIAYAGVLMSHWDPDSYDWRAAGHPNSNTA